jgi:hypothetical protein
MTYPRSVICVGFFENGNRREIIANAINANPGTLPDKRNRTPEETRQGQHATTKGPHRARNRAHNNARKRYRLMIN